MKKVILLLLMVLPVVIVVLAFAIAGYVGREIMFVVIEDVRVSDSEWDAFMGEGYRQRGVSEDKFALTADVGGVYELEKFFTVAPAKAKFSDLTFTSSNPSAARPESGRILVTQNMRSSDGGEVEISAGYGDKLFFTVYVQIKVTPVGENGEHFDYFGFDYDMLKNGISSAPGLSVFNGRLIINTAAAGTQFQDFGRILRNGIDTAPYNLLYNDNPGRVSFANSLNYSSSDESVLSVVKQGQDGSGVNIFAAEVLRGGEVRVTVITVWKGVSLETSLTVSVQTD